jgi:hypothetical protein
LSREIGEEVIMAIELTPELEIFLRMLTEPALPVPDYTTSPRPKYATVRELDIRPSGNRIDILYSRANHIIDLDDISIEDLLKMVASPGYNRYPDEPKPPPNNQNKKYDTPLSLANREWCYVIFKLTAKNWQFAAKRPPVAISVDALKAKVYFEARRVDPNGVADPATIGGTTKNGCTVAYVIADGRKATSDNPQGYSHPFNLHVDIVTEDWQGNPSYIPITIDPDIRFPGGSGA